jgi:hypothetical protein
MLRQTIGAVFSKRPLFWRSARGEERQSEPHREGKVAPAWTPGMQRDPMGKAARKLAAAAGTVVAVSTVMAATLVTTAGQAVAADAHPCARPQVVRASHWVQYCPLWRGHVPVYTDPDHGNNAPIVGYLNQGGSVNWFVGDDYRSKYTLGRYYNHWWAFTLADNNRWGWVPEVYFSGGVNDETDAGLYLCGSGPHYNKCSP